MLAAIENGVALHRVGELDEMAAGSDQITHDESELLQSESLAARARDEDLAAQPRVLSDRALRQLSQLKRAHGDYLAEHGREPSPAILDYTRATVGDLNEGATAPPSRFRRDPAAQVLLSHLREHLQAPRPLLVRAERARAMIQDCADAENRADYPDW